MKSSTKYILILLCIALSFFVVYQYVSFVPEEVTPVVPAVKPVAKTPLPLSEAEERIAKEMLSKPPAPLSEAEQAYVKTMLSSEPKPLSPEDEEMRRKVMGI